jgi:U3 small nucleolar RNA-associated protein 13
MERQPFSWFWFVAKRKGDIPSDFPTHTTQDRSGHLHSGNDIYNNQVYPTKDNHLIRITNFDHTHMSSDEEDSSASSSDDEETPVTTTASNNDQNKQGDLPVDEPSASSSDNDDVDDDDDDADDLEGNDEDYEDAATKSKSATPPVVALLSKSWSVNKSHVPTFTGGKVVTMRSHKWMLLPVHGDLAIVDGEIGVKVGTLRGSNTRVNNEDDYGDEEDDGELDREAVTSYALASNDQLIMTCTRNLLLQQYSLDPETGGTKFIKTWSRTGHTLPVTCMSFHTSNIFLATGSVDGTVRIWDVRGAFVTHVFRPFQGGDGGGSGRLGVTAIAWKEAVGQLVIAIARDDGSMAIHDLRDASKNNASVVILRDHVSSVTNMEWWGEEYFLSTGRDAILSLWRIVPREETDAKPKKKKKNTAGVSDKLVVVQKMEYRRIQSIALYEQVEGMVTIPSKNPKELCVVTAGSTGSVRLWKALIVPGQTPELKLSLEQPSSQAFGDRRGGYMGLVLNVSDVEDKNKAEQLIAVDAEHNISFLSSQLLTTRTIVGHNDEILDLKVIPGGDSNSIIVATNSAQIRIFDLGNFSCHVLDGHSATVLCVEASPCGRYVASCGKDKTMRLWRVQDRKCIGVALGHTEPVGACGLSRKVGRYEVGGKAARNGGGAFCITASMDRTLKRWNLPGLDELSTLSEDPIKLVASTSIRAHEKDINIVAVAPNDSLVASGSQDKTVKLWNATDLSLRATLKGHKRGVWDCQFSPIDRVIATSSGDKTIKLWSLSDYSCVRTFQGHVSSVLRVRFLRTGLQLLSAGADGLLKLWTIRTNECETTLDGHANKVWALDIHPNGTTVISGGADSKIAIWEDTTRQVEDEKRAKEAETILLDQQLANHLRYKEYGKALEVAIQANKPLSALKVINSIVENDIQEKKGNGLSSLQEHVRTWDMERVAQVLKFCRDWNTRARNAAVAMLVVQAILTTVTVEKLCSTRGIPEIMACIVPYAERHFERLDRLYTSSYFVDYTLSNMGDLTPTQDAAESERLFNDWAATSKLVLPPKHVDGRIQVGGQAIIGAAKPDADSDSDMNDDDEVRTIGDSSSDEGSDHDDRETRPGAITA